jgi:hypothetical protein
VSFKTNVNRAKTKKWVQAKKNAYDGDDWGEYDEYDEYGVNQDPEPPAAQRSYGQQQSRSFTEPFQQAPLTRGRRNSFEQGEEQRAFSSSIPYPQQGYAQQHQQQTEGDDYGEGHDPLDKRNFASSTTPHPLQTRISQVPAGFTPPITTQFPPRKSSIGQRDSPSAASPPPRNDSQPDKPLPFIRPADIYKRHQDEQERASLEASRPSLDEIASQAEGAKSLQPMDTVTERKSEYLPDFDAAFSLRDKQSSQQADSSAAQSDDLRSVVDQAFTRTDDQRSVPPTPISNDSGSDLLRSNTGSTSGISPIMSRVPSSATSALKNRNQAGGEGSTPAIAEEPSETVTPVSQPTTAAIVEPLHQVPRKPSPGHSRNFSSSSTPRSGLATPTRGDSPARSPILAPHRDLPEPKSALFTTDSNESSEGMEGGLKGPSSAYSAREADIATAMANSPTNGAPELSAAELQSQNTFLESHNAQYSVDDALPRDRSESPSKGRVQALAGKFGDVASSRRGSTQSNLSRNSVQSWEKSRDNSRAASPTKASPGKPSSPAKEFRPHLPGQWESYATTAMTPSEHGEQDRGMSVANNATNPLEKTDLTPTTAKRSVAEGPVSDEDNTDPIAALRDAGAAMVHSIRTTVGLDDDSYEQQQQQQQQRSPVDHGDVYHPRPLQLDRTISSISSMPPTPPAKDTPASEIAPPAPLKEKALQPLNVTKQLKRPSLDPQLSTDPSAEDQESDRLRKEIVASLTPVRSFESPAIEPNRSSLLPSSPGANRASSILPSEYDTYWAEEDRESPRPSQDTERNTTGHVKTVTFLPQTDEPSKPVILHRFSWEESNSQLQTPDEHAQPVSEVDPIKTPQADKFPSPAVEPAAKEERNPWSEGLSDSYFGPSRTITVTKPESAAEPQLDMRPSTPPPDPTRAMVSPSRERSRSPGLHVVNTELDPEAVDLPPRFSAEHEPPLSKEPSLTEKQPTEPKESHPATSPVSEVPKTPITHEPSEHSPTTDKPLGAREIATLNSSSERIATYNKTRDYWATADHGLQDWLSSSIEANPDLATPIAVAQRPTTGSVRHRHTGSLALFGKLAGSSSHDHGAEQHNSASTPVAAPTSANSPTTGAPSGSGFGGRIANQQMQLKGKDLLHTANVLSGKGMTSAKGFFAKGKSRFGREKVEK